MNSLLIAKCTKENWLKWNLLYETAIIINGIRKKSNLVRCAGEFHVDWQIEDHFHSNCCAILFLFFSKVSLTFYQFSLFTNFNFVSIFLFIDVKHETKHIFLFHRNNNYKYKSQYGIVQVMVDRYYQNLYLALSITAISAIH